MRAGARGALAALLALALGCAGCGRPPDEAWLRLLGFRSTDGSYLSVVEGDLHDGAASKVDAVFNNASLTPGRTSGSTGTGITIRKARVEYKISGYRPPTAEVGVSLYLPPSSISDGTVTSDEVVLADFPLVSAALKDWLIATGAFSSATGSPTVSLNAEVTFYAETDEGTDLEVSGNVGVALSTGGGGSGSQEVSVSASVGTATLDQPGVFKVTRTGSTADALTVSYTASGTAAAGTDYETLDGYVVIGAGRSSGTVTVNPIQGYSVNSTVIVTLTAGQDSSYVLGSRPQATVTLVDSGASGTTVNISATTATASIATTGTVTEGEFEVSRDGDTTDDLTVYYTVGGTATSGTDYAVLDGSVGIPAGSKSATVSVTPLSGYTPGDTVIVTLSSDSAYTLGSRQKATVTLK